MENLKALSNEFISTIQTTKNLSAKTIIAYTSDLQDFVKYSNDVLNDEKIVLKYIRHLSQEKHLKDSTINRKLIVLKMFFEYLYSNKFIEENYYKIHTFKFKKERRLPKTLEISEIERLIHFAKNKLENAKSKNEIWKTSRNIALIDVLVSTGIRIAEASNISIDDIILSEHTILIHGKGRKQRIIYISCLQTWNNIIQWIEIRNTKPTNTDKLFVNKYGEQLSIHGIEYIYRNLREQTNINCKSTPHYFRHTFATNLLANGADLRSVQEILGHSSVSTTEIYTEVTVERKKQVLDKYNFRNKF